MCVFVLIACAAVWCLCCAWGWILGSVSSSLPLLYCNYMTILLNTRVGNLCLWVREFVLPPFPPLLINSISPSSSLVCLHIKAKLRCAGPWLVPESICVQLIKWCNLISNLRVYLGVQAALLCVRVSASRHCEAFKKDTKTMERIFIHLFSLLLQYFIISVLSLSPQRCSRLMKVHFSLFPSSRFRPLTKFYYTTKLMRSGRRFYRMKD